jgi:Sigma-70, region 4
MPLPEKLKIADRAGSASRPDFCRVFEQELKHLYLLAFLLMANHRTAEQCFAATVEQALNEPAVPKDWVRFHIKRSLIKNAIAILSPPSAVGNEKRDFWSRGRHKAVGDYQIGALTRLPPLERFVFVMSLLERYSDGECSLLLGCSTRNVAKARMRALRRLSEPVALFPRDESRASRLVEMPA